MDIQTVNSILRAFKIKGECASISEDLYVKSYDFILNVGTKLNAISKISPEISMCLREKAKPNIHYLYSEGIVRFEYVKCLPQSNTIDNLNYKNLECFIGKDLYNKDVVFDIKSAPNTIVAGTTGSGKSKLLQALIINLVSQGIYTWIIDPKQIDFSSFQKYDNISISSSYEEAHSVLDYFIHSMNHNYEVIKNTSSKYISPQVLIIDEFNDLLVQDYDNTLKNKIIKLSQKCRAAHIYMILATQRPSTDVICGTIKANFPARICCRTASAIDSRIVLGTSGAENLHGAGDALLLDNHNNMRRFQVSYTTEQDILSL